MLKCSRCGQETAGQQLSPGAVSAVCSQCMTQSDDGVKRLTPRAKGKNASKEPAAHAARKKRAS